MDIDDFGSLESPSVGRDTLKRFRYQLEYVLLRWLEALTDASVVVYPERNEDLDLLSARVGEERIQVKTATSGQWTFSRLTAPETPVLTSFAEQAKEDPGLKFRFVSNASGSRGSDQVGTAADLLNKQRAGGELDKAEAKRLRNAIRRFAKTLPDQSVDHQALLMKTVFEFSYCGLDDLQLRVMAAIRGVAERHFDVTPTNEQLEHLYNRLVGVVFLKSSGQVGADDSLTHDLLMSLLTNELRSVRLGGTVNLKTVSEDVTKLLTKLGTSGLEPAAEPDGRAELSEKEQEDLSRLQQKLLSPSDYASKNPLVKDRHALSWLLEKSGDTQGAEAQLKQVLVDADDNQSTLFCTGVYAYANFLARARRTPEPISEHLGRYFESCRGASSYQWVEASHVLGYLKLAGDDSADTHRAGFAKLLSDVERSSLEDVRNRLHYDETLVTLEGLDGNASESIAAFERLLSEVEQDVSYDHERLRVKVLSLEPLLSDQDAFDDLFRAFSKYYEEKSAWGERADLYKERASSAYGREEFAAAIPLLRVAEEGYARVASMRGFLLTRHMVAHCYEHDGRRAAALQEYLGLGNLALHSGNGEIATVAVHHASRVFFEMGLLQDSLNLLLGFAKMAWVFAQDEDLQLAIRNIPVVVVAIAADQGQDAANQAVAATRRIIEDEQYIADINDFVGAVLDDERDWNRRLRKEDDATREAMEDLRGALKNRRGEIVEPCTEYECDLGSTLVTGKWAREPALRHLVLGVCAWLERFKPEVVQVLGPLGKTVTIQAIDFEWYAELAKTHDWVQDAVEDEGVCALAGQASDGSPVGYVGITPKAYENAANSFESALEHQIICFLSGALLGVYGGSEFEEVLEKLQAEVLEPNKFAASSCEDLASSFRFLSPQS